jgi:hypothetical protein
VPLCPWPSQQLEIETADTNLGVCGEIWFDQLLKRACKELGVDGDHLSEARSSVMLMNDHRPFKRVDQIAMLRVADM